MSRTERSARWSKRETDGAMHRTFLQLAADAAASHRFEQLIRIARKQGRGVFLAPVRHGYHAGVESLAQLALWRGKRLRSLRHWQGCEGNWRQVVHSLGQHLHCHYAVPQFLAAAWARGDEAAAEQRGWYCALGEGRSVRALGLPMTLTRRMAHLFGQTPDHVAPLAALRRAEVLAMGGSRRLVEMILASRVGERFANWQFWRTVWQFLIRHEGEMRGEEITSMVDLIDRVRHVPRVLAGQVAGPGMPLEPGFSMVGRTLASMRRLVRRWGDCATGGRCWNGIELNPFLVTDGEKEWQIVELTSSEALRAEGYAMRNCVARYVARCLQGWSSIWSLRVKAGERYKSVMTIEVDPKERAIVQRQGFANREPRWAELMLLKQWAERERLRL
jgi:hypothetical protein